MRNVVQIVKCNVDSSGKGKISLDEKAFKSVIKDGNAYSKQVAVISLCGEYGKGKSLLANFILQYLKNEGYADNDNSWLEEACPDSIENDDPGIFLYKNVMIVGEIAVLVMQVQGRFSTENKNSVFSKLFALGTLISSVQVINLQTQLHGRDVLFMKEFLNYASKIGAEVQMRGEMKVALKILLRDWPYPKDNEFGYEGGKKYLESALESSTFSEVDDATFFRHRLRQNFSSTECFLMPHPGLAVKSRKGCKLDDLNGNFLKCVKLFIEKFLTESRLEKKQIMSGGKTKQLNGQMLLEHAHNCVKEIGENQEVRERKESSKISARTSFISSKKPLKRVGSIVEHKAVSILDIENGKLILAEEMFEKILKQPEIGDKPIAIISIAGTFRKGKSFIMNFFIRYMRNKGYLQENDEWLGDENCFVEDGFGWKSGIDAHTQGIVMYTEPFIVDTPNGEVAVLFLDTQGLFDSNTSKEMNMLIFALNTIISSVQVLNISMNLQESDLEFIQLFTEYARKIKNESTDSRFLQSLGFLIRDWQFTDDYKHGSQGGREYLESYMKSHTKPDELKRVREFISSKFKSINCFLMPHPGFTLLKYGAGTKLKDLEEDFRLQLTPLASSILHPENLVVKMFCEKPMNARALYASAVKFSDAIAEGKLPSLPVMMDVVAEASNNELRKECLEYYTEMMKKSSKNGLSENELHGLHNSVKKKAIAKIFTGKEFGGAKNQTKAVEHVTKEIDNARSMFIAELNHTEARENLEESKEYMSVLAEYRRLMETLSDKPIDPKDFDDFEQESWTAANNGKDLKIPNDVQENMEKSRHDFSSLCQHENIEKYDLMVEGLHMPGNYLQVLPDSEHEESTSAEIIHSENVQDTFNEYEDAAEKEKDLTDRQKSELFYKYARKGFLERRGCSIHFKQYIRALKNMDAENEPTEVTDVKVLANIRLRNIVDNCLTRFDEQTKQYSDVFVRRNLLDVLLRERKNAVMDRYLVDASQAAPKHDVVRHRKDLDVSLNEKIKVAEQENERNRVHFNNAKEEIEKRLIQKYHAEMDRILKTGFVVVATLKEYHRSLIERLEAEISADDLPFYFTNEAKDETLVNFRSDVSKKLDCLYQEKKKWNKNNHGFVVRTLANILYH